MSQIIVAEKTRGHRRVVSWNHLGIENLRSFDTEIISGKHGIASMTAIHQFFPCENCLAENTRHFCLWTVQLNVSLQTNLGVVYVLFTLRTGNILAVDFLVFFNRS